MVSKIQHWWISSQNGTRVYVWNIPTEKTGALSIQPKRPVWISATSTSEWKSIFPKFPKRGRPRGIAKIFGNFFPEFLECSVEWLAIQQFPENFCICRCYANFRKFWFNGKRPRSTCSDVLLLRDIFHRNDPKCRVSNRIFQKHFVNGKQTRPLVAGMNRIHNPPSSRSDVLTTNLLDLHGGRFESTNMAATAKGFWNSLNFFWQIWNTRGRMN